MMGKKIVALSVLLVGLCTTQTARAIPYTGSVTYEFLGEGGKVLSGTIDFGVFDKETDDFAYTPPGEGRYIYAYQIKNDQGSAQEAVGYFAILLQGASIDGIGSDVWETDTEAVEPSETYLDDEGDAVFMFQSEPEEGSLLGDDNLGPGMHSYILIFTSENDWVPGDYEISGGGLGNRETPTPVPPTEPEVPEPATILILGIGASIALAKKRRFS
jgi:hypothetical protein